MSNLIYNEWIKLAGKQRLLLVLLILLALVSVFAYAQFRQAEENRKRYGDVNWRIALEQRIAGWESRMQSSRTSEEARESLRIRIAQQRYYLDHDLNPAEPGAPTFVRGFIESSVTLLLPLMMMIVAADLVSSEHSGKTMKSLLTRSVKRWKILLSKYLAMLLAVSLVIAAFAVIAALVSGIVFGFRGWSAPVAMGFALREDGQLDITGVRQVPQWLYIWMELGLAWYVSVVVATITFMLSVLARSTAAVMGIMLSLLIAGMLLGTMVESWESAKYLFMVNLDVIGYLQNAAPPVAGMSLGFSMLVLLVWAAAALVVAFVSFTRRDVV